MAYDRISDTPAERVVKPSSQRIEKRGISICPIVAQPGILENVAAGRYSPGWARSSALLKISAATPGRWP